MAKDNFDISIAVGLEEVGINKVLCMKNGYTLLFHFENNKPLKIISFDTLHKKVANTQIDCKLLDVGTLSTTLFKGLYEINGEAVLFMEQQNSGRHSLIRLRFNPVKGNLIDETTMGKSHGLSKPMKFYVMMHKGEPGYEVLYSEDVPQFKASKINVTYYNARHESYRVVPIQVDRKKYDFMNVIGAESLPEGVCISFGLSNMLVNGTGATSLSSAAIYKHYLQVFYIPKDSTRPKQRTAELSSDLVPYYTHFSYNPFVGTINLMLLSYTDAMYQNGIDMQPKAFVSNLLFRFDEQTFSANYNWLTNDYAEDILIAAKIAKKQDTFAGSEYHGFPMKMVTNNNGLSTLVSESYERYANTESYARSRQFASDTLRYSQSRFYKPNAPGYAPTQVHETYLGNICISQFDDDGKELWGTVLPKMQFYKSYRSYYNPADLAKRWQQQAMFNDMPPQVYERQFVSANVYHAGSNLFVIFNDCDNKPDNTIQSTGDTMYMSSLSNVYYYRINRKREITKGYLLGDPLRKEYKSSFVEGADFDEQRGVYASLIRYKRGAYVSLRMAWAKLE